jgi:D-alanine-D-alanine ligase
MAGKFRHVAVLCGGWSAEREVSLVSGKGCADALRRKGYDVTEIDVGPDLPQRLAEIKPDACFNALHGRWGEDGCVQGLLEVMRMPYTHSGVLPSALAMDKAKAKAVFKAHGLPIAPGSVMAPSDLGEEPPTDVPFVLKPANDGSSVGVAIIRRREEYVLSALPEALLRAQRIVVERYVPGRELTVSVMDGKALAVTDIVTDGGFYDYRSKYTAGGARRVIPADLPEDVYRQAMRVAEEAHAALGCRGVTRSDFRYDAEGAGLVVLEVNTQPGMTPTSLLPAQAAYVGLSYDDLAERIMEDASCGR